MISRFFIYGIWLYQRVLSPLLNAPCCFYPSCSEYARGAFTKYPWKRAFILSIRRILKCHPRSEAGVDLP